MTWHGAWERTGSGFALLSDLTVEVVQGRQIQFLCELGRSCFEFRAPEDVLPLGRLPEGPGRTRFLRAVERYSRGGPPDAGETEELNRVLRESAISFSEIVTSWYQVSFPGEWMRVVTWQHTEGFDENAMPGARLVRLADVGAVNSGGDLSCARPGCVLFVESAPIRFDAPSAAQATRLAALLSRMTADASPPGDH